MVETHIVLLISATNAEKGATLPRNALNNPDTRMAAPTGRQPTRPGSHKINKIRNYIRNMMFKFQVYLFHISHFTEVT